MAAGYLLQSEESRSVLTEPAAPRDLQDSPLTLGPTSRCTVMHYTGINISLGELIGCGSAHRLARSDGTGGVIRPGVVQLAEPFQRSVDDDVGQGHVAGVRRGELVVHEVANRTFTVIGTGFLQI